MYDDHIAKFMSTLEASVESKAKVFVDILCESMSHEVRPLQEENTKLKNKSQPLEERTTSG